MLSVKEFEHRVKKAALEALEAAKLRVADAWRFINGFRISMDKQTITMTHATSNYNDESVDFANRYADLFQLIGTLVAGY